MADIIRAFSAAFRGMFHPRIIALVMWPVLIALGTWLALAYWYWNSWYHWLLSVMEHSTMGSWLTEHGLGLVEYFSATMLLVLVLAPAIVLTALMIAAVMEMPIIVKHVGERYYPTLEKRHGGTFLGSIGNAFVAVSIFAVLWIITLPLWLTGVLGPVLAVVLSAYLNQKLFRYDALAEHASSDEYKQVTRSSSGRMYILGALLAMLYFVPLLNLLVPVLSGLAYTHFCLAQLSRLRRAGHEVLSIRP